MEYMKDDFPSKFEPRKRFRVIVVGAGISGLATAFGLKRAGHDVVVLEKAHRIVEVGAGIQLAPNATRVLHRFGILNEVMDCSNILKQNCSRRWKDDVELGRGPLMPEVGKKYNAPLAACHRGDLQRILLDAVYAAKVEVLLEHKVVAIDPLFSARVQLASGKWMEGDLLIAADGIKSIIRNQMIPVRCSNARRTPTGDAAYRVLIPREKLRHDPQALKLLDSNIAIRWLGPDAHVVAYPIKNSQVLNLVLIHPQKPESENVESWTNKGDRQEMLDYYKDWNGVIRSLLTYVPKGDINEWTLNHHLPLPHWVQNQCALVGDACHAMLPYVAQGAAQAIEDAGVLTVALSLADDVPTALRVYEKVRKGRGEKMQDMAAKTRTALHLPDGSAQVKRDMAMAGTGPNPDLWADRKSQDYMWAADNMKDTVENWENLVAEVQ